MARKYKLTGCAKFFVFFIIAAPIAYVGASYYNGQDPIKEIREFAGGFFGSDNDQEVKNIESTAQNTTKPAGTLYQEMELKDLEIKTLKKDLEDCKALNDKKDKLIDAKNMEIKHLEQQTGE
jgi:hypothetical protein